MEERLCFILWKLYDIIILCIIYIIFITPLHILTLYCTVLNSDVWNLGNYRFIQCFCLTLGSSSLCNIAYIILNVLGTEYLISLFKLNFTVVAFQGCMKNLPIGVHKINYLLYHFWKSIFNEICNRNKPSTFLFHKLTCPYALLRIEYGNLTRTF